MKDKKLDHKGIATTWVAILIVILILCLFNSKAELFSIPIYWYIPIWFALGGIIDFFKPKSENDE